MNDDAAVSATGSGADAPRSRGASSPVRWIVRIWGSALLAGVVAFLLAPAAWGVPERLLTGWNAVIVVGLACALTTIVRSTPERARAFARATDPGNVGLLLISVLVSGASVLFAVVVLAAPQAADATPHAILTVGQVIFAIFGGWTLMQTAFTLHYARLYYARTGDGLDLKFPDGVDPDDLDFAYFAFGIGVAFQVSDVAVTTRAMRRAVLVHSLLSFAFNAAILALMVNLLAGRI